MSSYIKRYNLATYHLALLFILLTSTRPTHTISIKRTCLFNAEYACVKDKGRMREILICDYLKIQIDEYLALQVVLSQHIPSLLTHSNEYLWYLLDDEHQPQYLNAKLLRQFMSQRWPNKVPYQFRHTFAQAAGSGSI